MPLPIGYIINKDGGAIWGRSQIGLAPMRQGRIVVGSSRWRWPQTRGVIVSNYFCIVKSSERYVDDCEEVKIDIAVAIEMIDQITGVEGPVYTLLECLEQLPRRCAKYGVKVDDHVPLLEVREQLVACHQKACRMHKSAKRALVIASELLSVDQIDEERVAK